MRHLLALVAAAALVCAARPAAAQSAKAAADAAFEKGKQLMATGDARAACPAFEDSQRLDPQLGTQYNLAVCYEKTGRLTSAWVNYSEVAAKDARGPRKDDAARRARALEPRLSRLVIAVRAPVPGETVKIGALDLGVLAGTASPIDEGSYDVVAAAPGFVRWRGHVEVRGEAATVSVDVPPLAKADVEPVAAAEPVVRPGHRRRVVGAIVAGAGVAAIAFGLGAGAHVFSLKNQAETACGGALTPCDDPPPAQDLIDSARSWATISDVAIGVGAAAVIGGAILYATAPRAAEHAAIVPVLGPDRVGLGFAARF